MLEGYLEGAGKEAGEAEVSLSFLVFGIVLLLLGLSSASSGRAGRKPLPLHNVTIADGGYTSFLESKAQQWMYITMLLDIGA